MEVSRLNSIMVVAIMDLVDEIHNLGCTILPKNVIKKYKKSQSVESGM